MNNRPTLRPPAQHAAMLRRWSRVESMRIDSAEVFDFFRWLHGPMEGTAWRYYATTLRALFRNRKHRNNADPQPGRALAAQRAFTQLRETAHQMRTYLLQGDYQRARLAAYKGDAAIKTLHNLALHNLATRALPFVQTTIKRERVIDHLRTLKTRGLTREQARDDPSISCILAELNIEDIGPRTLDEWLSQVYGKRGRGRPKGPPYNKTR